MTYNRILATGVTGIYKDQGIEIVIGNNGHDTIIKANGKEIKNVLGCWIKMIPDKPTTVTLELLKRE